MPKLTINPPELFDSLQYGFSQIVISTGTRTVYLSGQVAWDESQQIVGAGDLAVQTRQTLANIEKAMIVAGGQLSDVVSLRIYIVETAVDQLQHVSQALRDTFRADQAPATTWIIVQALANEAFLIEIEAIGVN